MAGDGVTEALCLWVQGIFVLDRATGSGIRIRAALPRLFTDFLPENQYSGIEFGPVTKYQFPAIESKQPGQMSYNLRNPSTPTQGDRGNMPNYGQQANQGAGRGRVQGRSGQMSNLYSQVPLQQSFTPQLASTTAPAFVTQPKQPAASVPKSYEYHIQPQAQNMPQPSTPEVVKDEVMTPIPTPTTDETGDNVAPEAGTKTWSAKKKAPGYKVNRKLKRLRQNARLRKVLQPKNAIMVLNELKAGAKFVFHEQTTSPSTTTFTVGVEVEGKSHMGYGLSKTLAKQNAAENALKALLLEKMALSAAAVKTEEAPMEVDGNATLDASVAIDASVAPSNGSEDIDDLKDDDDIRSNAPEDEVPWGSLASFALYKLFLDWQNQGSHVPLASVVQPAPLVSPPSMKIAPMKQLPENPTERHPVMLLSQMRPGVKFVEKTREGVPPNMVFTLEVTVDGVSYEGIAKNKKEAKKEAAKAALAGFLGISYT